MRIAVVGAGALGLYYGAVLQRAGEDVAFLLRRDYEAIMATGLTVRSINGDFHLASVRGARRPEEIGPVDLVIVGLKTFANEHFSDLITPLVGAGTYILTLQNGLGNEEALADLFGAERIMGGVAFLCANRDEPGTVHHLGAGRIELGAFAGALADRVAEVAASFVRGGIDCRVVNDLRAARWRKLVWNIPYNGLCALLDQSVDRLQAFYPTRELVRAIMGEVIAAANAQGLNSPIEADFADRMLLFTDDMGVYRPSMQLDRTAGRPLEIDAILARPLAAGTVQGIDMPRVRMLFALLSCVVKDGTGGNSVVA
ncbi:putative 2-dehydropantoate 2-reductase [Geobacter sp. AOG1]|uniref:putative 2-dehydropantoate 2-reductase n=1 Tax=Geobacter sp. AOG1 TaxID=1566346 RepID=UPI001CC61030|nr:putative 2-dehydropantoate 2-reductase [Geobacter sp. AOG1]GFE58672.1 2-dehydropantoate 2-reductase [Geobacter sp. AOG1]